MRLYVHVPFCRSFCIYCDFYSELACSKKAEGNLEAYLDELCAEIRYRLSEVISKEKGNSLYIGGGTPSVLPLSAFERILKAIGELNYEEFTVEVNPEDIIEKGKDYVRGLLELGVNRISMGVQSLDDKLLYWMRRRHNANAVFEACEILRSGGVKNLSLDLIFGISGFGEDSISYSLDKFIAIHPEHISAYQLSIEEGSDLAGLVASKAYEELSEGSCARQYELICCKLQDAGYMHYEISNWALPGCEARHNSAYWERQPYLGFGPAAHSFDGTSRSWNSSNLTNWTRSEEVLTEEQIKMEKIMLGLRTARGIPSDYIDKDRLLTCIERGTLIYTDSGRVRIPESHWFVSDAIIEGLV